MAQSSQQPAAFAFSAESAKVVHLVRHGQGTHNVEAALHGAAAYAMASLQDARLDETGRAQARALGVRLREARIHVDVALVSPLSRTIETACLMFPDGCGVPLVAVEMCREAHGGHPCDQRRPISAIRHEFPRVDYSLVETDDDVRTLCACALARARACVCACVRVHLRWWWWRWWGG